MKKLVMATALLYSFSTLAGEVELTPESNQFHFIQSIGDVAPAVNIEAYERELRYLQQGLSLDEKVRSEANILAESIRMQVINAYDSELEELGNEFEAYEKVREMIHRDLELADEGMKEDLLKIAEHALQRLVKAPRSQELDLSRLEDTLREDIKSREAYLLSGAVVSENYMRRASDSKSEAPFQNFSSKNELVKALVSNEDNSRWIKTAATTFKAGQATSRGAGVALQVKIEFLGVSVEAGPRINFRRDFSTNVNILADGLDPVIDSQGRFDFYEKDKNGRATKNRRFIAFFCDATLNFKTDYEGKGGFKVAGAGVDGSYSKEYSSSVTLNSRRLQVPEHVGNKVTNLSYLSEICHNDFLNARINSKVRVRDSLDTMMKNVVKGLRFTHPDTKCAIDSHCSKWFKNEVLGIMRNKATARCVENKGGVFACALRGTKGQACTVYENGKRTSSGMGEYICDKGLRCVKTRDAGWLQGGRLYQPSFGVCK